jgi:hypothetical protein
MTASMPVATKQARKACENPDEVFERYIDEYARSDCSTWWEIIKDFHRYFDAWLPNIAQLMFNVLEKSSI